MTPNERVEAIFDEAVGRDLSSWERHKFLPVIRNLEALSMNQENVLRDLERRLFGRHFGPPHDYNLAAKSDVSVIEK